MSSSESGINIEKMLQSIVILLLVAIVVVMGMLVKGIFFKSSSIPRTSVEKQLQDAQKAIRQNPSDLNARLMLAITYSQMGEYEDAEQEYLTVIQADKKMAKAYYLLALNYEKMGKIDKAIQALQQNDDEQSLFQLGRFFTRQEKYEEAVEALKKALKKRPEGSDTLYYLGLVYEKQGKTADAAANYKKALSFAPDFEEAQKALERVK